MKLQLALDEMPLVDALRFADKVAEHVDIIEIGTPFVMESDYHITRDEYRKYQDTEWPEGESRLIKNGDLTASTPQGAGSKPIFTNEEDADDGAVLDETLSGLLGKFTEGEIKPWLESDDDQTEADRTDDDHTEVDHEE